MDHDLMLELVSHSLHKDLLDVDYSVSELTLTEDNTCSNNHNVPNEALSLVNELLDKQDYFTADELSPIRFQHLHKTNTFSSFCFLFFLLFTNLFVFCSLLSVLLLVASILFVALITVKNKAIYISIVFLLI